ncbi:uncharacterized protein C8Q71DRAFT_789964 [Rhodofomes roseus]|uniref:Yeast cell wall synthesis Kre9/Knh1-like N-terminal domain-containing protein n=1 Tax=Rhodofomes roseus TaxID=34475 RepID=A0ABQ8JZ94_9APHY|nr:uncharacterized protein C8Q71DRAFT_789964 [Rhodofomes roseus]KAH9829578.1 hypothetical protein C8Q71DRAFT_789964 [Rhodofomes roseus]
MFSFAAAALLVFVACLTTASASIYVNNPTSTAVCYGGQPCTVTWLDDGQTPLLSEIGACYVGLYNGNRDLIQQIDPVNVASQHSFTFTPDATAGPDSSSYYVNFTSVELMVNSTSHYAQYSADFTLANMSGDLASPVASDTAAIAVPSSILSLSSNPIGSTSTITYSYTGSYSSLAVPSISTSTGATSRLSTSRTPSSTSASSSSSATSASSAASLRHVPSCGVSAAFALAASVLLSVIYI